MAIQAKVKELVAQGGHRAKVTNVATKPHRQYMAACRDCDFKGGVGSGGQAEKEALAHAEATAAAKSAESQEAAAS